MSQVPIEWESVDVTPQIKDGKTVIPDKAIESVKKNYVALKGPLAVCPPSTTGNGANTEEYADADWERPRVSQLNSAENVQSFCQRSAV